MNMSADHLDNGILQIYADLIHDYLPDFIKDFEYTPWVWSIIGSIIIGLSGIFPLIIIPSINSTNTNVKKNGDAVQGKEEEIEDLADSKFLKVLLSFAVGGLLGDVFLHLLPEAWEHDSRNGDHSHSLRSGAWVLFGVLLFTIVEKIFSGYCNADEENPQPKCVEIANCLLKKNGGVIPADGKCSGGCDIEDVPNGCFLRERELKGAHSQKKIAGYLNLLANSIDNFTHGLAVAGSFLVSMRHGILATFAILLHEIPHEVGDFAILLKSGFNRWDAAKAQLLTATAGLMGAVVAIGGTGVTSAMEAKTSWIMPFTAGGFLHISLVTVLPDLLKEDDPKESFKQMLALLSGIGVMAIMTILFEH